MHFTQGCLSARSWEPSLGIPLEDGPNLPATTHSRASTLPPRGGSTVLCHACTRCPFEAGVSTLGPHRNGREGDAAAADDADDDADDDDGGDEEEDDEEEEDGDNDVVVA
eukprot:8516808-Pyramimonas_sp.AAC.1